MRFRNELSSLAEVSLYTYPTFEAGLESYFFKCATELSTTSARSTKRSYSSSQGFQQNSLTLYTLLMKAAQSSKTSVHLYQNTRTIHTHNTSTTRTIHTQYTHNTHTIHTHNTHAQYTHNTRTINTQYTHNTHAQYTHNTHNAHAHYTHTIHTHTTHTIHTHNTHNTHPQYIRTNHTQYTHNTRTIHKINTHNTRCHMPQQCTLYCLQLSWLVDYKKRNIETENDTGIKNETTRGEGERMKEKRNERNNK